MSNVLPVLKPGDDQLTSLADIAAYLVRFTLINPGGTSDYLEDSIISLRYLLAKYQDDISGLVSVYGSKLTTAIRNYFPDSGVTVNVSYELVTDEDGEYYSLITAVMYPDNTPVIPDTKFIIKDNTITLDFYKQVLQ